MNLFYNFEMEVPTSDIQLINELGKWLRMAGSICKVIIVLDAVNQLDEGLGQDGTDFSLNLFPVEKHLLRSNRQYLLLP